MKQPNEKDTPSNTMKEIGPPPTQFADFVAKYIWHLHYCQYQQHHPHHQHQQDASEDITAADLVGVYYDDAEKEEYDIGAATRTTTNDSSRMSLRELISQQAN